MANTTLELGMVIPVKINASMNMRLVIPTRYLYVMNEGYFNYWRYFRYLWFRFDLLTLSITSCGLVRVMLDWLLYAHRAKWRNPTLLIFEWLFSTVLENNAGKMLTKSTRPEPELFGIELFLTILITSEFKIIRWSGPPRPCTIQASYKHTRTRLNCSKGLPLGAFFWTCFIWAYFHVLT